MIYTTAADGSYYQPTLPMHPTSATYVSSPHHSESAPISTSLHGKTTKRKRKQVKNACVNCQKACKKCDEGRACQRCIKLGLTATCVDSPRKERHKGIKRGPYKKRKQYQQPLEEESQYSYGVLPPAAAAAAAATTCPNITHDAPENWYYQPTDTYGNHHWTTNDPLYMLPQHQHHQFSYESSSSPEMLAFDSYLLPQDMSLMTNDSPSSTPHLALSSVHSSPTTPPSWPLVGGSRTASVLHHPSPVLTQQHLQMLQNGGLDYHYPPHAPVPWLSDNSKSTMTTPLVTTVHIEQTPYHHWPMTITATNSFF